MKKMYYFLTVLLMTLVIIGCSNSSDANHLAKLKENRPNIKQLDVPPPSLQSTTDDPLVVSDVSLDKEKETYLEISYFNTRGATYASANLECKSMSYVNNKISANLKAQQSNSFFLSLPLSTSDQQDACTVTIKDNLGNERSKMIIVSG
jgi:PBP1b-binding outer membrane lipoprotein LpoB